MALFHDRDSVSGYSSECPTIKGSYQRDLAIRTLGWQRRLRRAAEFGINDASFLEQRFYIDSPEG